MIVAVVVMMPAGQEPGAGDIDQKAEHGDRDRLVEADRNRVKQPRYRLIADQQRHHRQHDGAGISREVAELAGAEGETAVVGISARKRVSQGRQQQRPGMGRHVQSVGDKRERAEQRPADDFGEHHDAAQDDDRPGPAFRPLMVPAQKHVMVWRQLEHRFCIGHGCSHFNMTAFTSIRRGPLRHSGRWQSYRLWKCRRTKRLTRPGAPPGGSCSTRGG